MSAGYRVPPIVMYERKDSRWTLKDKHMWVLPPSSARSGCPFPFAPSLSAPCRFPLTLHQYHWSAVNGADIFGHCSMTFFTSYSRANVMVFICELERGVCKCKNHGLTFSVYTVLSNSVSMHYILQYQCVKYKSLFQDNAASVGGDSCNSQSAAGLWRPHLISGFWQSSGWHHKGLDQSETQRQDCRACLTSQWQCLNWHANNLLFELCVKINTEIFNMQVFLKKKSRLYIVSQPIFKCIHPLITHHNNWFLKCDVYLESADVDKFKLNTSSVLWINNIYR